MIMNDCVLDLENSMDLEPAATPWYDRSRYKNNATITTGTGGWVQRGSGLWGYNYSPTTRIVIPDAPSINHGVSDMSIIAWVLADTSGNDSRIITKQDGAYTGYFFSCAHTSDTLYLRIQDADADKYNLTGTTAFRDDLPHMVGASVDRDVAANCKLYMDGEDDTASRGGVLADIGSITSVSDLNIGSNFVGSWRRWVGPIFILRIFSFALTDGQMRNYYEKTRHLFGVHG